MIFCGHYIDVAVGNIVMAIGAFVLVKLSVNERGCLEG